jgi:hypothetical protein
LPAGWDVFGRGVAEGCFFFSAILLRSSWMGMNSIVGVLGLLG